MKKRRTIEYKELIELFATRTINDLKSGKKYPKLNILLEQDGLDLLKEVKENPFKLEGYWTLNISNDDIEKFLYENNCDENYLTLHIKDSKLFFKLLTEIVNRALCHKLQFHYVDEREYCMYILERIWLRMGPNDFCDVIGFLEKQLDFLKNDWLYDGNSVNYKHITQFFGNKVFAIYNLASTYDETFYKVEFSVSNNTDDETSHNLSSVRYGLREEDGKRVCYIYALQNNIHPYALTNRRIQRKIFEMFKNNYDVHPNQVYTMYLFLKELKKHGINKVKIPLLQVLNYPYHEIMYENKNDIMDVNKRCDMISELKTEKLLRIMEVMKELFEDFTSLNDLDTVSDTWEYSFTYQKKK